jgi:hypothetical protein
MRVENLTWVALIVATAIPACRRGEKMPGAGPHAVNSSPVSGQLPEQAVTGMNRLNDSTCQLNGPVHISQDSVGPLPIAAPLVRLLKICSGVPRLRQTEEHEYPALEFRLGGLTILASQTAESLSLNEHADTWEVTGTDGVLPMGQSLNARWETLWRTYGLAVGRTMTDNVTVMFCKFPRMFLDLDATLQAVGPVVDQDDLRKIPPDARIVRIIISSGPVGWHGCGK